MDIIEQLVGKDIYSIIEEFTNDVYVIDRDEKRINCLIIHNDLYNKFILHLIRINSSYLEYCDNESETYILIRVYLDERTINCKYIDNKYYTYGGHIYDIVEDQFIELDTNLLYQNHPVKNYTLTDYVKQYKPEGYSTISVPNYPE